MPPPPVRHDSFDKINFVIDAWTTGCDAPWYIYIETMRPALLTAFITLITFGWDDVLRGFFRPKGLYKRRTGKRKGKFGVRRLHWPEFGNMLGKNLGGMTGVQGARWNSLGKTLWRIDGAMEMVRFYWLVAAIAEDFVFDWTSLLYESYWCQPDAGGNFSFQTLGYNLIRQQDWKLAGFGTEDYENSPPSWGFNSGTTGPNGATITAALKVRKVAAFPPPTSFRVIIWDTQTGDLYGDSGTNDQLVNGAGAAVATGGVPPNKHFQVRAWLEGTPWAEYGDGVVIGVENVQ